MTEPVTVPRRGSTTGVQPPSGRPHSLYIEQELQARGVVQVIVILAPAATSRVAQPVGARLALSDTTPSAVQSLAALFVHDEHSAAAAIAKDRAITSSPRLSVRAASAKSTATPQPVRYYANLGVMLGNVNRDGLEALKDRTEVRMS